MTKRVIEHGEGPTVSIRETGWAVDDVRGMALFVARARMNRRPSRIDGKDEASPFRGDDPIENPIRAEHDPLWQQILHFPLDEADSQLPFTRRLARENGWSLAFALRVVTEYRRFLFLGQRAGHPVTPSDEVDQAWHLHLIYTYSYWQELCAGVLAGPFHHGPTRGGGEERGKYHDLYAMTLESYRRLFGEEPPSDVWPSAEERFAIDALRVRRRDAWVIRKPWRPKR